MSTDKPCCLTCAGGALRDPSNDVRDRYLREMASLGWINCDRSPMRATFCDPSGTCEKWTPAPADVVKARQEWLLRRARR